MICTTIIRRIVGPVGGAWIPYSAKQVAARRAGVVRSVDEAAALVGIPRD